MSFKLKIKQKSTKINVLSGEKDSLEELDSIISGNGKETNYSLVNKTLDNIETYLKYKEKMLLTIDDYEYLISLSKELKNQSIRIADGIIYIPLFKITSKDVDEKHFLTRNSVKEYIELHNEWYNEDIIEIEEINNDILLKSIQIIKRNFK